MQSKQTKDDWKEQIKQEIIKQSYFSNYHHYSAEKEDVIECIDIAIAKTEEHFKCKNCEKKEAYVCADCSNKVTLSERRWVKEQERKAFADWLEKKLREHLDGKIAFGVFYHQCHDKINELRSEER